MGSDSEYHPGILKMKFIFNLAGAPLAYNQRFFMSTIAEVRIPTARRSSVLRVLLWLFLALLLLMACAVGYAYYVTQSALPQLDGQLQISGLSAPVTVIRDTHGVPTIEAATLEDLFFAQ